MNLINNGNVNTISIGGVLMPLAGLIALGGVISATAVSTMRKPGASAGYQVTAGKTLTIMAFRIVVIGASASDCQIGYGDNDTGFNSGSNQTNAVWMFGNKNSDYTNCAVAGTFEAATFFPIPATKFPSFAAGGATVGLIAFGFEA